MIIPIQHRKMKPSAIRYTINAFIVFKVAIASISCAPNYGGPNPHNYEDYVEQQDKYPAFSPDGNYIAYYHYSSQMPEPIDYPSGLYIIERNGDDRKLVLEGHHYDPDWSPDGEWLVFSTDGVIQKCKTNGDSLEKANFVDVACFFPDFSPDGEKVLFDRMTHQEGSLLTIDARFARPPEVFSSNITTGRDAEYSRDGMFLAYMKGSNEWPHWEIFVTNVEKTLDVRLTNNTADDRTPSWGPDSQKICWSSNLQLHTMNADGSHKKLLTYGQHPSWSSNDEIVFSHANADYTKEVLFTMRSDGTNKKQITF